MYKIIKSSENIEAALTEKSFTVTVNFAGYIGADEDYEVMAMDADSAIEEAIELAKDDLTVEDVNQIDEDEWEVSIGFCDFIGVEEIHNVSGSNEDEAIENALEEAVWDLSGDIAEEDDDDFDEEDDVEEEDEEEEE